MIVASGHARKPALRFPQGDGRWTLVNASPDLPAQIRATARSTRMAIYVAARSMPWCSLAPRSTRSPDFYPCAKALLSRFTPRRQATLLLPPMRCMGAMTSMSRRAVNPGERFMLAGDIEATLFMVPGKLPLYLEGEAPELDTESAANVGIELHREGARLVFVPGAAAVTESNARTLRPRGCHTVRWHVVHR